jgi:hypothetical protein
MTDYDKVLQVIKEMWLDRFEEAVKELKEKNHG